MPLRVLVVSHLYPSSASPTRGPWLAEQVVALAEQGLDVEVLCCSPFEQDSDGVLEVVRGAVRVHYRSTSMGQLNGTRSGLVGSTVRYARELRRFLRERSADFDVLHAHFAFPDGWLTCRAGRRRGLPVVVTVHGSDVARVLNHASVLSRPVRRELSRASRIVCVSDELERLARASLRHEAKTTVIPNGFDEQLFHLNNKTRDLGFLFVGVLTPVKNIQPLVEVYLESIDLHALPLTVIGAGPLMPDLERLVASSPSGGRVALLGELDRTGVADAMQRARVLVLPSQREGYGAVAAEALACGTPVVASRVGGLPDILADEAAGLLIEPGDRAGLLAALRAVRDWRFTPSRVAASSGARPWHDRAQEIARVYREVVALDSPGGDADE